MLGQSCSSAILMITTMDYRHATHSPSRVPAAPVQRPGPPIWVAMRRCNPAPLRRAARYDGAFPIETRLAQVRGVLADGPPTR